MSKIQTFTGLMFDIENPTINIIDIAHALSLNNRYNGHSKFPFSVARHSILVGLLMKYMGKDPLEGLLHDAAEAYLSDVPRPIKQLLPDWNKLEKGLDKKIRAHFGLPLIETPECKFCDIAALYIEATLLFNHIQPEFWVFGKETVDFVDDYDQEHNLDHYKFEVPWLTTKVEFLMMYDWWDIAKNNAA